VLKRLFFIPVGFAFAVGLAANVAAQTPVEDVTVYLPADYDESNPCSLVISLHGYGGFGASQELRFPISETAALRNTICAFPTGALDSNFQHYWNATDACCDNVDGVLENLDHVGYLAELIAYLSSEYSIDPRRVHLLGHSNGGFMVYRMACDRADLIASIVPISAATWFDPAMCVPAVPVSVLHIHGTNDPTIAYEGGSIGGAAYPGAEASAAMWASNNECSDEPKATEDIFDAPYSSSRLVYPACHLGSSVELWTLHNVTHVPSLPAEAIELIFDFFDAHPKPSCLGDLDGDDVVDGADIGLLLSTWDVAGIGDINSDGTTDGADLGLLIAAWGACG
jgi:polyhydroxybutyrate depolymerase